MTRKIEVVEFDPKQHWPLLQLWWTERKFPVYPLELLPRTGFVVKINDQEVCAGFLTMTDCRVASIGHLVSDPRVPGEYRNEGLDVLLANLCDIARQRDCLMVFMSTNIESLKERFLKHNFKLTDEYVSIYGRRLCHGD
jgi:hypothetical protein